MPMSEAWLVAGLGLVIVMATLCILALFIVLFSKFVVLATKSKEEAASPAVQAASPVPVAAPTAPVLAPGTVRLVNVDDKTAAIIMAIVSDTTKIPLERLVFKCIQAVD